MISDLPFGRELLLPQRELKTFVFRELQTFGLRCGSYLYEITTTPMLIGNSRKVKQDASKTRRVEHTATYIVRSERSKITKIRVVQDAVRERTKSVSSVKTKQDASSSRRVEHTAGSVLAVRDQGARKRNAVLRRRFFVLLHAVAHFIGNLYQFRTFQYVPLFINTFAV